MSFKSKFDQFPILETRRLLLRQLNQRDAAEFQLIKSDPDVFKDIWKQVKDQKLLKR